MHLANSCLLSLSILCAMWYNGLSQNISFEKTYANSKKAVGIAVVEAHDNGYVLVGYEILQNLYEVVVLKIDNNGDSLWIKGYKLKERDEPHSCARTHDNGFIISGQVYDPINQWQLLMLKIDSNGNQEWMKSYFGGPNWYTGFKVIVTSDGNYVITGAADRFGTNVADIHLAKISQNGNLLWAKYYREGTRSVGFDVIETPEYGLMILGRVDTSFNQYAASPFILLKTDNSGNELWRKIYPKPPGNNHGSNETRNFTTTKDNGYVVAGRYLTKVDSAGNVKWLKPIDTCYLIHYTAFNFVSIKELNTSELIMAAYRDSSSHIIKTNSLGDSIWSLRLEWPKNINQIITTSNSELIGIGTADQHDLYAVKISNFTSIRNIDLDYDSSVIIPNPISIAASLQIKHPTQSLLTISLYDISGRLVNRSIHAHHPPKSRFKIIGTNFSKGIYFYRVSENEGLLYKGKFIVQ